MDGETVKDFTAPLLIMVVCMTLRIYSGSWYWWVWIHYLAAGMFCLQAIFDIFQGKPIPDIVKILVKMSMFMLWGTYAPVLLESLVSAIAGVIGLSVS